MWVHMCTNTRRPWDAALTHTYARTHTQHTHSRPNPIKLACGIRVWNAVWLWVFARHPQCATADSKILVLSATFVVIVVGDSVSSPSCNVLRPGKETTGRGASCCCLFMCRSSVKSFGARLCFAGAKVFLSTRLAERTPRMEWEEQNKRWQF